MISLVWWEFQLTGDQVDLFFNGKETSEGTPDQGNSGGWKTRTHWKSVKESFEHIYPKQGIGFRSSGGCGRRFSGITSWK